jgi:hypothetical protein
MRGEFARRRTGPPISREDLEQLYPPEPYVPWRERLALLLWCAQLFLGGMLGTVIGWHLALYGVSAFY